MAQLLLVEGKGDIHAITHLLMKRGFEGKIKDHETPAKYRKFIKEGKGKKGLTGGKGLILEQLSLATRDNNLSNLGIIVDADESAASTYQSIQATLIQNGYRDFPKELPHNGLYQKFDNKPNIGIWIMPNNQDEGYLEHFLYHLIPENDDLTSEVEIFIQQIIGAKKNRFALNYRQKKAEFYTWLALQESPELSPGIAIKSNYFDINNPLANHFIDWFQTVFSIND